MNERPHSRGPTAYCLLNAAAGAGMHTGCVYARAMKRWMLCMGLLLVALAPAPPGLAGIPQVPQDTLAERVKACTACHGEQGRAGLDGCYPRLVGKPTGYLYQQSLILAQGHRHYGPMAQLVDPLTPAYLRVIAEYFTWLQVPYPPPLPVPMSPVRLPRLAFSASPPSP